MLAIRMFAFFFFRIWKKSFDTVGGWAVGMGGGREWSGGGFSTVPCGLGPSAWPVWFPHADFEYSAGILFEHDFPCGFVCALVTWSEASCG